ncbi:alpha/beta hydrolase [Streptomyces sp. H27-D2]|uniref:alpha/beta hydrolase n=1 Tax=Streptomyces sp. H27-D2 TaxID=3046304 RepID=UPI002DB7D485|nr:alpha/beta hydrolase [Streptomyces sp. H27-D2]MEC4016211.1 alpha/beta hydrolase [Streptomyces sp. H27-D2]
MDDDGERASGRQGHRDGWTGEEVRWRQDGRQPHQPLLIRASPREPRAAVLLLHGGQEDGLGRPMPLNPPALRMRPFARAIGRRTAGYGVALGEVRYRHRGWNGSRADAVPDARAAIEEFAAAVGPVPLILVGHSMGARAALRLGGHPGVRAVIGLAPWCPEDEPVTHLAGASVVLVHSDRDRITNPAGSLRFAVRAREAGAEVCRLVVPGSDHAMLRRAGVWHTLAAGLVAGFLGIGELPPHVVRALAGPVGETGGSGLSCRV